MAGLCGATEGSLRTVVTRDCRDFVIISRDNKACYQLRVLRGGDTPRNKWIGCEQTDILPRDSLRSRARWDESKDFKHLSFTTTKLLSIRWEDASNARNNEDFVEPYALLRMILCGIYLGSIYR
jgi:hypothetical protein